MEKYSLDLCSPSCGSKGKLSWYEVMKTGAYLSDELWISNFCEMGCMFFTQNLIKKFKEVYDTNTSYNEIKDYGIDHIICNFVNRNAYRCGIVKNITYYNPLKIDSNADDCGFKEWKSNIGKLDLAYRVTNIHVKQKITIDKMKVKKKKFLVCISSYKRPLQLLGQIHRFNNQSFKDLDISVVVRGCDDFVYDVIKKECGIYDNVFISKAENGDQLNNLLDCIRQVNANNYDYFCKIDDDDIYSIDYIKNIYNKIQSHKEKNKIIGFCNRNPLIVIKEKENSVSIHRTIRGLYGNTLGFDRSVFEILDEISKNKNNIKDILSRLNISIDNPDQYLYNNNIEDKLIDHIMTAIDCDKRIYLDIALDKQLYYCKLSPGIVDIK